MDSKQIVLIGGSVRPGNYTNKALRLVADELEKEGVSFTYLDPAEMKLPLPGEECSGSEHDRLQQEVERATGVILATPEYHGSYSSVTKLVIDNLGFPSKLAGKPIAMLGVAAGRIGAIKALDHLSGVCLHAGAFVLPGAVSVANCMKAFDEAGKCLDETVEKQVRGVAHNLLNYIGSHICPKVALENMVRREKEGI